MNQIPEPPQAPVKERKLWIIPVILGFLFCLGYLYAALSAPLEKLHWIHDIYADTTGTYHYFDGDTLDQAILDVQKEIAFTSARLAMAKSDSICLSINLEDSLVFLEIRGVVVHQARIKQERVNTFFSRIDPSAVRPLFAKPFIVSKIRGNGPQNPIIVKKAPKDTIEAALNAAPPDTGRHSPVFFFIQFENGLGVYFEQVDERDSHYHLSHALFRTGFLLSNAWHILADIFRFRAPNYHPMIRLRMSRADVKAIYRSLPQQALVSIKT
jgi:hypothetical protein